LIVSTDSSTSSTPDKVGFEHCEESSLYGASPGWCYVSGYFDGDGCVDVDPRKYTLHWVVSFTDNWFDQVQRVKIFLESQAVKVGNPKTTGMGAWKIKVSEIGSLRKMGTAMLRCGALYKKEKEIRLLLDYYENRITGNEVAEALNEEVTKGVRIGKIRRIDIPFTHSQGLEQRMKASVSATRALADQEQKRLMKDHVEKELSGKELSPMYGVSEATVSRIIRALARVKP